MIVVRYDSLLRLCPFYATFYVRFRGISQFEKSTISGNSTIFGDSTVFAELTIFGKPTFFGPENDLLIKTFESRFLRAL